MRARAKNGDTVLVSLIRELHASQDSTLPLGTPKLELAKSGAVLPAESSQVPWKNLEASYLKVCRGVKWPCLVLDPLGPHDPQ